MVDGPSEGGGGGGLTREMESVFNLRLMTSASHWEWVASLGHSSASGRLVAGRIVAAHQPPRAFSSS